MLVKKSPFRQSRNLASLFQTGIDPGLKDVLQCPGAKDAYILLKILKTICVAQVKSYELKKIMSDIRRREGDDFARDLFE